MKQLFVFSLFLVTIPSFAQDNIEEHLPIISIFNMLQYDETVHVTIETDLDSLINERKRESYQPAKFTYQNIDGRKINRFIKIKPRGKYRRRVCDFPTIKLNFSKKDLKASGMAKYDKYKLVTHCMEDEEISRENVLREYLVYKMYNILSEKSYRVQFLKITYKDSKGKLANVERTAFLIEDSRELADRIGGKIVKEPRFPVDSFHTEQYNFVALFQYMIGNVDWRATPYTKNTKAIKVNDADKYQLIPYDFDFCGVVNVPYMRLAEHLNQTDSRHRIFLGNNDEPKDLETNIKKFQAGKKVLLNFVNNFDLLSKASRRDIKKYMLSFYEDIADGVVEIPLILGN